jgi:uncharacterized YigZ family protein
MNDPSRYPVPAGVHRTEQTILRSRFITTLAPAARVEEASAFVRRIGEEFPDATHCCWAYVVGPPGSTARVGLSDAGETHGTAGRPMLNALLHSGVGDVVAVVTRYYGGTKLGTGGLVRAYGGSVQQALATLPRVERVDRVDLTVAVAYASLAAVQALLPQFEAEVAGQEFGDEVSFQLRLPAGGVERFRAAVRDATRGQARFEEG